MTNKANRAQAEAHWGRMMPEWIAALADECDRTTQRAVADRIGYSASVINQVLKRTYKGSMSKIERAVRVALIPDQVPCPVLGSILESTCLKHQRRPSFANHELAELARTCPACPHRESERTQQPEKEV